MNTVISELKGADRSVLGGNIERGITFFVKDTNSFASSTQRVWLRENRHQVKEIKVHPTEVRAAPIPTMS